MQCAELTVLQFPELFGLKCIEYLIECTRPAKTLLAMVCHNADTYTTNMIYLISSIRNNTIFALLKVEN